MRPSRDNEHTHARSGIDYYGVLSLNKTCNDLEIKEAFRRLAIRNHPKSQENRDATAAFSLTAEAYDVLSDPFRKVIYDQYGEAGLKNGVCTMDGYAEPYVFHGEPMRTFREFFGTESPYADLLDILARPLDLLEFPEGRGIRRKEEPLIRTLQLSLSEVFFGGVKKMKIQKLILLGDEKCTTAWNEKILTVPIKPGILAGTRIVFPEEGDEGLMKVPADVIFITEDRPDETFERKGSDLHMKVDIFLREALIGTVVVVNTIDDRTLRIPITSVVTSDYQKVVAKEGLPLPENPRERGNLILTFNIEFPFYLPVASKDYINKAFETSRINGSRGDTEYIHRFILARKMRRNLDDDVPLRCNTNDEECKLKHTCD